MVEGYRDECRKCEELKRELVKAKAPTEEIKKFNRGTVLRAFVLATAVLGVAAVISGYVCGRASLPDPPPPPLRCVETAEIVTSSSTVRTCGPLARLVAERLESNTVLIRCTCPADAPEAVKQ